MVWFDAPAPLLPEILALNAKWLRSKPALIEGDRVRSWGEFDEGTHVLRIETPGGGGYGKG